MDEKSLLYTASHEWIEATGDVRRIGISDHAQHMLGDIVFVEMPAVGKKVGKGDEILTIESPKAAASVYAPVAGEIVEVNESLDKIRTEFYELLDYDPEAIASSERERRRREVLYLVAELRMLAENL